MFDKIKDFVSEHKSKAIVCICFVSVYVAGIFSGSSLQTNNNKGSQLKNSEQFNYTTKQGDIAGTIATSKTGADAQANTKTQPLDKSKGTANTTNGECFIKGSKSRIYHMPDGAFYERTSNPIACFNSEEEAQAAGFTKSSR